MRMRCWDGIADSVDVKQTPGVGDGQGGLACCGPRGRKVSDTTEQHGDTSRVSCEVLFPA